MWAYSNEQSDYLSGTAGLTAPAVVRRLRFLNPVHWLRTWLARELATTELYDLDDRSLADLGITRGDFPAILSGTYRRGE